MIGSWSVFTIASMRFFAVIRSSSELRRYSSSSGGHVVERLGDGFEFAVARKVEPLPVVVVGDLA